MTNLARSLALSCSLIVALPPGWCCVTPPGSTSKASTGSAPSHHCCVREKCGDSPSQSPTPAPQPCERCPCMDRDLSTPEQSRTSDMALTPAPFVALPELPNLLIASRDFGQPTTQIATNPLHVLNCTWLC